MGASRRHPPRSPPLTPYAVRSSPRPPRTMGNGAPCPRVGPSHSTGTPRPPAPGCAPAPPPAPPRPPPGPWCAARTPDHPMLPQREPPRVSLVPRRHPQPGRPGGGQRRCRHAHMQRPQVLRVVLERHQRPRRQHPLQRIQRRALVPQAQVVWTCSRTGNVFGKKYIPVRVNMDIKIVELHRHGARKYHGTCFYRKAVLLSARICAEEYLPKNVTCPGSSAYNVNGDFQALETCPIAH